MFNNIKSKIQKTGSAIRQYVKKNKQRSAIIAMVAVFGVALLISTTAAGFSAAIETETGSRSGSVQVISDTTASGGGAIQFGSTSGSGLVIVAPINELDQLKTEVATSGYKQTYWNYVKTQRAARTDPGWYGPVIPADWNQPVSWPYFDGTIYTFNPKTLYGPDHVNDDAVDAHGNFMISGALNAYTCGLRWYLDNDSACGDMAVNYIDNWSSNFQYAQSRSAIDGRDNQVKLNSGWYVSHLTKAAEVVWNHPNFTTAKKQKFANWLWTAFLNQDAILNEVSSETLGGASAGWNGRLLWMQARLNSGLVMKAAGNSNGDTVINDIKGKIDLYLPEILYYGKDPWHEILGQPWPNQGYRHLGAAYGEFDTADGTRDYWFFESDSSLPPPFFVGQSQETGRDMGHHQSGAQSISEILRSLRLNGYGDRYTATDLGTIMLQMGERHAKFYNEAIDEYWRSPSTYGSSVDGVTRKWLPSEWTSLQLSTDKTTVPLFKIGGSNADMGWEILRKELKAKGYSTPQLDRLTARLRGTGTRSSTNAAGTSIVKTSNNAAWDPLFGVQ